MQQQQPAPPPKTLWEQMEALAEYVVGHVDTPEEKLAKIKLRLEEVRKEARRAAIKAEWKQKDAAKAQAKAARDGNAVNLRREARAEVMAVREHARLSSRLQRIEMTITQVGEAHGDRVVQQAQLEMMQAVLSIAPMDTAHVAQLCGRYQMQRMRGQEIQGQMNDMLEEAYDELDDDAELGPEDEARIEEIVRLQSDLVAQQQAVQMPRAPNTHIAMAGDATEAELRRANREGARDLEQFLARK